MSKTSGQTETEQATATAFYGVTVARSDMWGSDSSKLTLQKLWRDASLVNPPTETAEEMRGVPVYAARFTDFYAACRFHSAIEKAVQAQEDPLIRAVPLRFEMP